MKFPKLKGNLTRKKCICKYVALPSTKKWSFQHKLCLKLDHSPRSLKMHIYDPHMLFRIALDVLHTLPEV